MDILEKCKLSNFDEKLCQTFIKNNKNAVIIKPFVDDDGETDFFVGLAELYHPRGGKKVILWTLNYTCFHHIHFDELGKLDYMYLCENRNEAKKLYSEWCKSSSAINEQKEMINKQISKFEKKIFRLKEKLSSIIVDV